MGTMFDSTSHDRSTWTQAKSDSTRIQQEDRITKVTSHRRNRPHTKSRGGCFNCKTRRVKCQETFPICENCKHKNLACVYPTKAEQRNRRKGGDKRAPAKNDSVDDGRHALVSLEEGSWLSCVPSNTLPWMIFTADDMRFFHHFMLTAHPHLPFGSDKIWVTEIPKHAHESPLLMHSILALGATHLSLSVPSGQNYLSAAVEHRGIALKSLAEMMARQCSSIEMSQMLATCYALTFQSYYMPDSLLDFAVMVRGCAIMTDRIRITNANNAIFKVNESFELLSVLERLSTTATIDSTLVDMYMKTLVPLQPLLESEAQHKWYLCLVNTLTSLQHSDRDAYLMFTKIYGIWYEIDHNQFLEFSSTENSVSQILFLHFIAVQVIMLPILMQASPQRMSESPRVALAFLQWADAIYNSLPRSIRKYVKWQMDFIRCAQTAGDIDDIKHILSTSSTLPSNRIMDYKESTANNTIVNMGLEIQE